MDYDLANPSFISRRLGRMLIMKSSMCFRVLLCLASANAVLVADVGSAGDPLRLRDGQAFVAVYYFGHWWDPWKSEDEAIRRDFARLREMGVSVIAVDHEWSQAIDGNWRWLDREHRLAKEAGLDVVPWLSLKVWSDLSDPHRMKLMKQWYDVDLRLGQQQDGSPGPVEIWDEETIRAGAAYAADYVNRYRDQALLHVRWKGRMRPVVALSVELAWSGGFDTKTTARFHEWLKRQHRGIEAINARWNTSFGNVEEIDPRDTTVFDYANLSAGTAKCPRAVEDHIEFRAQRISDALGRQATLLRQTHPDVLVLAELPYQFASRHSHAEAYRIQYAANPSCVRSADIIWFRCTGLLSKQEAAFLSDWQANTGQPAILTYRTYADWANDRPENERHEIASRFAGQAATLGNGFGFYSWNEMVDTHVAPSADGNAAVRGGLTPEQSQRATSLMAAMVQCYLADTEDAGDH
jgi:hypothetical protein